MKPIRIIISVVFIVAAIVALYLFLRQPPEWSAIKVGMTQEEVGKAVSDFDGPWDSNGIITKTESHWGFVWRLTLQRGETRIIRTSKELLSAWPRPVTLWSSDAIGAEIKVLNCIL